MKLNLTLVFAALAALPIHAASVTFQPPVTVTADANVSTAGTLVDALSFSSPAIVNGISFSGPNLHSGVGTVYNDGNFSFSAPAVNLNNFAFGAGTGSPWSSLSTDYQAVLSGAVYNSTLGSTMTVTLNGLSIGSDYLVQLWVNDNRGVGAGIALRQQTIAGANSFLFDFNSTNTSGGVGEYIIGSFTASGTSESFSLTGDANSPPQVNAIQLRLVPEPSAAMLGLGALGLMLRRRRK